jgi:hypothetical protein
MDAWSVDEQDKFSARVPGPANPVRFRHVSQGERLSDLV